MKLRLEQIVSNNIPFQWPSKDYLSTPLFSVAGDLREAEGVCLIDTNVSLLRRSDYVKQENVIFMDFLPR